MAERIGIVGAPSSAGAYAPGQERAPAALREAGLLDELHRRGVDVRDFGDTRDFRWRPDPTLPRAQNLNAVASIVSEVAELVREVRADRRVAIVLGGDCTVALGVLAGLAETGRSTGLSYLDLHADLNVPTSTADGALDWMGVAHMLAIEGSRPELCGGGTGKALLASGDIVLLGYDAALATAHERDTISRLGLHTVSVATLAGDPEGAAERSLLALEGHDDLAIHFDVDLVDFFDAPLSENTERDGGVTLAIAVRALWRLASDERLAAITIAELNPDHGEPEDIRGFAVGLASALGGGSVGPPGAPR
jgi:arginase